MLLLLLLLLHPAVSSRDARDRARAGLDPECFMSTSELIQYNGHEPETHNVSTPDGYIIQIFRIKPITENSPVVFLQHGFDSSSDDWVLNGNWGSFAFLLAQQGYDVWLGNVRGNIYGMKHSRFSPEQREFWDFSFQEMAELDLPATIGTALKVSGQENLFYVGHSQGTMMGFISFTSNPTLATKIKLFSALAPVARLSHARGLVGMLSKLVPLEGVLYRIFGTGQFDPPSAVSTFFEVEVCPESAITRGLCDTLTSLFVGFDRSNINETRWAIYGSHSDQSTSTKNIIHFAQLVRYGQLQKFDYGSAKGNEARYNQSTPPVYNVSQLSVPTILAVGGNDWLADTRDVMWQTSHIAGVLRDTIFIDKFNHVDFTMGVDTPELVYQPLMKMFLEAFIKERDLIEFLKC